MAISPTQAQTTTTDRELEIFISNAIVRVPLLNIGINKSTVEPLLEQTNNVLNQQNADKRTPEMRAALWHQSLVLQAQTNSAASTVDQNTAQREAAMRETNTHLDIVMSDYYEESDLLSTNDYKTSMPITANISDYQNLLLGKSLDEVPMGIRTLAYQQIGSAAKNNPQIDFEKAATLAFDSLKQVDAENEISNPDFNKSYANEFSQSLSHQVLDYNLNLNDPKMTIKDPKLGVLPKVDIPVATQETANNLESNASEMPAYLNDIPLDESYNPQESNEGLPATINDVLGDNSKADIQNRAAPTTAPNNNVTSNESTQPIRDVDLILKKIEDNQFFNSGNFDLGFFDQKLNEANDKLDSYDPSPKLRSAILHQELKRASDELLEPIIDNTPFTQKMAVTNRSKTALESVVKSHYSQSAELGDYINSNDAPYTNILDETEDMLLEKALAGLPPAARQLVLEQMSTEIKDNLDFGFDDAVNSVRQSLHSFDEIHQDMHPNARSQFTSFNTELVTQIDNHNKNNPEKISAPAFTPNSTAPITTPTANTLPPSTQMPNIEGSTDIPSTEPNAIIDTGIDNDLPDLGQSPNDPEKSGADNQNDDLKEEQDQEKNEHPTHNRSSGGGMPSISLFGGYKPNWVNKKTVADPLDQTAILDENRQQAPSADTIEPETTVQDISMPPPTTARDIAPVFDDQFADRMYQDLHSEHERLTAKFADPAIRDSELYGDTEQFLLNVDTLRKQTDHLSNKHQGEQARLEGFEHGMKSIKQLTDDISESADKKGLFEPEHPLNKERAKDDTKKSLRDKFGVVGESLDSTLKGVSTFINNLKNVFTRTPTPARPA